LILVNEKTWVKDQG